jgi:L-fuconolactonase
MTISREASLAQENDFGAPVARRTFLAGVAAVSAVSTRALAATAAVPIIDSHIHLFDATRPQGAPYPEPGASAPPPVSTAAAYAALARPLGMVGAIAVEASPWIEDNLWALQAAQADPIMVGLIGNLQPEKPEFAEYLDRFRKNPLFLGIRYATLWGYNLPEQVGNPVFVDGVRRLAGAGLVLETNASLRLLQSAARLTDAIPNLRVVIDHIAGAVPAPADKAAFDAALAELKSRPNIYGKLSAAIGARSPSPDLAPHKDQLDHLWEIFGEDRSLYGSDYPNSLRSKVSLEVSLGLMKAYMSTKSTSAQEKFFWRNSTKAYRWVKRAPGQPTA